MSKKNDHNSWFENKKLNTDSIWTKPKTYYNPNPVIKRDLDIKMKNLHKINFTQRKLLHPYKDIPTNQNDKKYLQVDKSDNWNMCNQKPYWEDRLKFDKPKHDQFFLVLGKFYQRKRSVKYRDLKWEQSVAAQKQSDIEYLANIRTNIANIKSKMNNCTRDELIKMKDEIYGYMKKLSENNKTNSAVAKLMISNTIEKAVYNKDEESGRDGDIDTKKEENKAADLAVQNNDRIYSSSSQIEMHCEGMETDANLLIYFELTQPDLLQNDYYEVYINNFLEKASALCDRNCAESDVTAENIDFTVLKEIKIPKEKKWTKKDDSLFVEELRSSNKDFSHVYYALGKNIKDIILHYYRIKKKRNIFGKRKGGRSWDVHNKLSIEEIWDNKSIKTFITLFAIHGKSWAFYKEKFPKRSTKDFKLLYRYLNKYDKDKLEKKVVRHVFDEDEMRKKYLNEFTISERQVFAMYYPFLGRNWIEMAQVCNKSVNEVRGYFRHYYKKLSPEEKQFETMMKEYDRDTLSCFKLPEDSDEDDHNEYCGILFKPKNDKSL